MSNSNGSSNVRNSVYAGKQSLLPPKSPFPIISPSYVDYVPNSVIGSRAVQKPREGIPHHQRTSSESVLVEEQPSWLDDLLNEPETPVRRAGHRRASSDSFTYMDAAAAASNLDYGTQFGYKNRNLVGLPSWGSQDLGHYRDAYHGSMYAKPKIMVNQKNRPWDSQLNSVNMNYLNKHTPPRDNLIQTPGLSRTPQNVDITSSTSVEKRDQVDSAPYNLKDASDKDECLSVNSSALETDTKRAKQQFAQRSRVRKLQYIAELERNVQALQTEGSEVSAELEFLNQQNLILGMENKALKQRLDSITQEQLIKYMEQEVLEREIGRLRALYQQQLQQPKQQPPLSNHRRSRSGDLDSQFASLTMKAQETGSSCEPASGPLRI